MRPPLTARLAALGLLLAVCAAGPSLAPVSPSTADALPHACLLISPNTRDDLCLITARERLSSPEHQRYRRLAGHILSELGVRGHRVEDALGEWQGAVENSLFVTVRGPADPAALTVAAAWFGLAARQKAVLAFHADPSGEDVLAVIDLPGRSLAQARALLDRHRLSERTLLARPGGWQAVVLAEGERRGALASLPAAVRLQTGRAVILAGPTQAGARQRYHEVIRTSPASCRAPALAKRGW